MDIKDFDFYKSLLRKKTGLYIGPAKSSLLSSRLTPIAKKWGYSNINMLTVALRSLPEESLVDDVVEEMMDLQTSFFRDSEAFDQLCDKIIPELAKIKRKDDRLLNIWSCGCSTGQETYSLKIMMQESPLYDTLRGLTRNIYATDISREAIRKAEAGSYSQHEVQDGLPVQLLTKHFEQNEKTWTIHPQMKRFINFTHSNLIEKQPLKYKSDIILCRNLIGAMAYDVQEDILSYLAGQLQPHGYILFGIGEDIPEINTYFEPWDEAAGIYILKKD